MKWFIAIWVLFWSIFLFANTKIIVEFKKTRDNDLLHLKLEFLFGLITLKFNIPVMKITSLVHGVKVKGQVTTDMPQERDPSGVKKGVFFTPRRVQNFMRFIRNIRTRVRDMNQLAKKTLNKVRCERLEWSTSIGLEDAAATGGVAGLFWGGKTAFITLLSRYIRLHTSPQIDVVPVFRNHVIDTRFFGVFHYRMVYFLVFISRILYRYIKGRMTAG